MTKARDTANIVGGGFSGTIAGATMEPTGDTAAGDNAAIGFTSAEGLILTGQGSTNDVTIKNDADADVIEIPTGTVNVTMAGTLGVTGVITGGGLVVPDGSIAVADLDIDGGTDIGAALVDADLMIVDDGAGGTNRKATMARLATYMGTKIGGGMEFISSSGAISNAASVAFTGFDASKYDSYKFIHHYIIPATDNVYLTWNSSTDGGSNYDTTNGHYVYGNDGNGTSVGFGYVNAAQQIGSDTNEFGIIGQSTLFHPHNTTTYKVLISDTSSFNTSGVFKTYGHEYDRSYRVATADIDAIRFQMTSGNIESGEITMFGIVNS